MNHVPFTELPADGNLSPELIEEICDPDNWSEEEFFTSIDGTICPHCKEHRRCGGLKEPAERGFPFYVCRNCRKIFRAEFVDTPMGKAWQTRKAERPKS